MAGNQFSWSKYQVSRKHPWGLVPDSGSKLDAPAWKIGYSAMILGRKVRSSEGEFMQLSL